MQNNLLAFGFGEELKRWVDLLYKNIERDCRQGDPIAPFLFLICTQILISMLKENTQRNNSE